MLIRETWDPSRHAVIVKKCSRRAQAKYSESFVAIGQRLWNVLPAYISVMVCLRTFKRVLTEWCLERTDRPPVVG